MRVHRVIVQFKSLPSNQLITNRTTKNELTDCRFLSLTFSLCLSVCTSFSVINRLQCVCANANVASKRNAISPRYLNCVHCVMPKNFKLKICFKFKTVIVISQKKTADFVRVFLLFFVELRLCEIIIKRNQ